MGSWVSDNRTKISFPVVTAEFDPVTYAGKPNWMTTGPLQIANSNKWKKFNNTRNENKKKMLPIYITCVHITSIWDHPCSLGGIYGVTLWCNCMDNWQRIENTAFGCNLFRRWRNENLTYTITWRHLEGFSSHNS